jgi:hypothetical protein
MAKDESRGSELMRFEARQRIRDFLLGVVEAALVATNILAEFVTFLARRGLRFRLALALGLFRSPWNYRLNRMDPLSFVFPPFPKKKLIGK